MKRNFLFFAMLCISLIVNSQSLFIGTYNVRNHNHGDELEGNGWAKRCQVICDLLNFEQPDIFGTQEVLNDQLNDLLKGLPGYGYTGVGRDDGKEAGEYSAIFYNKQRLDMKNNGNFWLNETPDKPALGWDAACIRICSWGEFEQKQTGFKFFFFNLHMDHVGIVARREAAKLAVKKMKEIAKGAPAILTGDFNVDQNNEIYQIFVKSGILKDCYTSAKQKFAENGTFNDFNPEMKTNSRIDHIFVSPLFDVNHYAILTDMYWSATPRNIKKQKGKNAPKQIDLQKYSVRTPSDHYPVFAKIELNKE